MALTQQFARITPAHLERCRASALDSVEAKPGWDPPAHDTLDALDHPEVYDGYDGPPRLLSPAAVSDISRALDEFALDDVLATLPADPSAAAAACGGGRRASAVTNRIPSV
ncbi:hypothetical protein [Streptomyces sp. 1222.5]|uniref:hypothetical protein n=1 Tax=Streptomyces sp. 1222.5 TaxID=1881026 RepID=UPI003D730DFC